MLHISLDNFIAVADTRARRVSALKQRMRRPTLSNLLTRKTRRLTLARAPRRRPFLNYPLPAH